MNQTLNDQTFQARPGTHANVPKSCHITARELPCYLSSASARQTVNLSHLSVMCHLPEPPSITLAAVLSARQIPWLPCLLL